MQLSVCGPQTKEGSSPKERREVSEGKKKTAVATTNNRQAKPGVSPAWSGVRGSHHRGESPRRKMPWATHRWRGRPWVGGRRDRRTGGRTRSVGQLTQFVESAGRYLLLTIRNRASATTERERNELRFERRKIVWKSPCGQD